MASDLQYLLEHVLHSGSLAVPIRVKLTQDQVYALHHRAEVQLGEGEELRLIVTGLNLVQADKELGTYIELEVGE